MKQYYRKYPKLVETIATRHEVYNASLDHIAQVEKNGNLLVIRPLEKLPISRTDNDPDKLRKVYEIGRSIAEHRIEEIKAFLH